MEFFFKDSYNLEKFTAEYKEPDSVLYIALDNLKIIGFLRLRKNSEVNQQLGSNNIELQRLYVHRDYQGGAAARKLMNQGLEYAQKKKYEWMWLGVWEKNVRAQKFYTKWGFERFSEHIFQMGDDPQVDWLYKKKL